MQASKLESLSFLWIRGVVKIMYQLEAGRTDRLTGTCPYYCLAGGWVCVGGEKIDQKYYY